MISCRAFPWVLTILLAFGSVKLRARETVRATEPESVCALFQNPLKSSGKEVWVKGRAEFASPEFGMVLGGACPRVVELDWDDGANASQSLGLKALGIAQDELFRDLTKLHRAGRVQMSVRGRLRVAPTGRLILSVKRVTWISISFLEEGDR
jgi:hypothetical protein